MAYNSDRHVRLNDGGGNTHDSFDPLLVNLHDTVHEYTSSKNAGCNHNMNSITQAVIDILDARLSSNEKVMAADILVDLIKQAESDIRRTLSERLAPRDDIHPNLLHYLAYDDINVAEPILLNSPLLSNMDLIYIIQSKSKDHWKTIAARNDISGNVVNNLIKKKDEGTIIGLLKNESIVLEEGVLEEIKTIAVTAPDVAETFVNYKTLPRKMAVDIYWYVSTILRQSIEKNFDVKEQEVSKALEECVQDFCDTMLQADNISPSVLMTEVAELYHNDLRITDDLLVGTLRRRQGRFFIALFEKRSNLSSKIIWNMMRQIGGQGLAVACRAMNVSKENFISLFLLSRTIVRSNRAVDANELKMAMRYYDGLTHKMAKEILEDSIAK